MLILEIIEIHLPITAAFRFISNVVTSRSNSNCVPAPRYYPGECSQPISKNILSKIHKLINIMFALQTSLILKYDYRSLFYSFFDHFLDIIYFHLVKY